MRDATGLRNANRKVSTHVKYLLASAAVIGLAGVAPAQATEGYFQNGLGARSKAMAGAGVANGTDATSAALNPAGIVNADNEADISLSVFAPFREFTGGSIPGFTPSGTVESNRNYFAIPNMAINWKTLDNPYFDAFTLSMVGNGGMNTSYKSQYGCGGMGVFCGGKAGVDLQQMLLSAAFAKRFGNVSVGVAPTMAVQIFSARGVGAFAGFSEDPANMTNRNSDWIFGGGLRGGVEWAIMPSVRLGVAGATPIWSQKMDKYKGLFAEQGDFDIPANIQAGIAVDINPALTLMLDYRHIWYSGTGSVSNPSTNMALFGSSNGPGFGWSDVDTIKVGLEWKAMPDLTLRAGYSYNTQPVNSRDVMLNILAPGVVQHHITGGFSYAWTDNIDLEFAGMYAPRTHVTGAEISPGNPAHTIDVSMQQFEATVGIKYKFGP